MSVNRAALILVSGFACAFVAMFVSLAVGQAVLPPSDGAYGLNAFEILRDPFVAMLAIPAALILGAVGSIAALFLLARTDLRRSIPFVAAVTVVATAGFSVMTEFVAAPMGLAIGVWAMTACRPLFPLKVAPSD